MDLFASQEECGESQYKMIKRICPVCSQSVPAPEGADHRNCVLELFKTNKIKSVAEWEKMSIVRRRISVKKSETRKE
jgi:hypothetical protein